MTQKRTFQLLFMLVAFAFGLSLGKVDWPKAGAKDDATHSNRVFELRTYKVAEGRLEALHARFREHTRALFEKHGITSIGYFTPEDPALSSNTLIYILAHPSREAAKKHWDEFLNDPEWQKVQRETEVNGAIVTRIDSVYMDATNYSPLK